jgi:hypothetical protein
LKSEITDLLLVDIACRIAVCLGSRIILRKITLAWSGKTT